MPLDRRSGVSRSLSLARFLIEFIRINPPLAFGLSEAQMISIVLMIIGTVMLMRQTANKPVTGRCPTAPSRTGETAVRKWIILGLIAVSFGTLLTVRRTPSLSVQTAPEFILPDIQGQAVRSSQSKARLSCSIYGLPGVPRAAKRCQRWKPFIVDCRIAIS